MLDLTHDNPVIVLGRVAKVEMARPLFVSGEIFEFLVGPTRADLLEYCKGDTWPMVWLRGLVA